MTTNILVGIGYQVSKEYFLQAFTTQDGICLDGNSYGDDISTGYGDDFIQLLSEKLGCTTIINANNMIDFILTRIPVPPCSPTDCRAVQNWAQGHFHSDTTMTPALSTLKIKLESYGVRTGQPQVFLDYLPD